VLWVHDEHPLRSVRLAYCTNLHPGETWAEVRAGLERITLPLRERLAPGERFGVGMYLAGAVLAGADERREPLDELARFLADHGLEPFTFNAFPYGGFHAAGLKERVYEPSWLEERRLAYTLGVARAAARFSELGLLAGVGHVSVSTHAGGWGGALAGPARLHECARGFARAALGLARIARAGGPTVVLALEAEPRSSANDGRELAEFLVVARARAARAIGEELGLAPAPAEELAARHLGTCLDCCHSAVEFEDARAAWDLARHGGSVGKVQVSSALTLRDPAAAEEARARFLALDEPRYLHQVTGRDARGELWRVADLPELARALEGAERGAWLGCREWRCHFHVPVDLAALAGLGTTRAHAEAILEAALADPSSWRDPELQLEIETYTWDVLPREARGAGELVDGLEREYRAVMEQLAARGWHRARA